jgi:hypothetical protein
MFDLPQRWHRAVGESIGGGVGRGDQRSCCWVCTPPRKIRHRFRGCKHTSLIFLIVNSPKLNFRFHDFCELRRDGVLRSSQHKATTKLRQTCHRGGGAEFCNRLCLLPVIQRTWRACESRSYLFWHRTNTHWEDKAADEADKEVAKFEKNAFRVQKAPQAVALRCDYRISACGIMLVTTSGEVQHDVFQKHTARSKSLH